ncbi:MAG TPA: histidine phosphatase family protein [Caulobacteraceae bacterium]|nr:histidine phosphatase family protein [Caulobacteraceae bacterium]
MSSEAKGANPTEDPAAAVDRVGAIVLARHGEPALSRAVRLNADEYRAWWGLYEEMGLAADQSPPPRLLTTAAQAKVILSSTRLRSIETAAAICQGRTASIDPDLIEAPLPPPRWPSWIRLKPRSWGVIARFWWWFLNHHDGHETRAHAQARADRVAERLIAQAQGGDVLVVAHGFFNTMVGLSLQRHGWRLVENDGFKYWSMRRFERQTVAQGRSPP